MRASLPVLPRVLSRSFPMQTDLPLHLPVHLREGKRPIRGDAHLETVVPGWNDFEEPSRLDSLLHAAMARATHGISPVSVALAYSDWAFHLMGSPGKWQRLLRKAVRRRCVCLITPPCFVPTRIARIVSNPCRKTGVFTIRPGRTRLSVSSIKVSCSINSGGAMPLPASAACPRTMNMSGPS